jgi:hypothetical protein
MVVVGDAIGDVADHAGESKASTSTFTFTFTSTSTFTKNGAPLGAPSFSSELDASSRRGQPPTDRAQPLAFFTAVVSAGTASKRSATRK